MVQAVLPILAALGWSVVARIPPPPPGSRRPQGRSSARDRRTGARDRRLSMRDHRLAARDHRL